MTQVGEGQEADEVGPSVMTFGAPAVGEILADRYELAEHINDDSAGRQVWRGVDVILRRPVAVVLRYPGGDSATEMLQAAVAASRVIHPNLVGVYDAIDEAARAYVVREWVDGRSLRQLVSDNVLDPARATSVAHAVAGAIAAIHATGTVHGNMHPGTVMIADDGRVMLADARTDGSDTPETDLRAVGGILYFALSGHWPHAETALGAEGRGRNIPDAVRDASGAIAAPRQIRAGIPAYLDDLVMDLLDSKIAVPTADVLAAELGRLDAAAEEQYLDHPGPLRFASGEESIGDLPALGGRRVKFAVAGLLAVALVGLIIGVVALSGGNPGTGSGGHGVAGPTATASNETGQNTPVNKPTKINISANQVRVIDPKGDGRELDGAEKVVDGDENQAWETDSYNQGSDFGKNQKEGMGILIDLGEARAVTSVKVILSASGATAELRTGAADAPATRAGDQQIVDSYTRVGDPLKFEGTTMAFSSFEPDQKYRYLLFWITELPESEPGKYKVGVQEISVQSR